MVGEVERRARASKPVKSLGVIALLTGIVLCMGCGTSLHDESARGNLDKVEAMVAANPGLLEERDIKGKTPVFFAIPRGRVEVLEALLEAGADVNAHDITGLTPLHVAAWWNQTGAAEILLAHGADLEARDDFGSTPLHVAAHQGRPEMIAWLIEHGADIEARNARGLTPLGAARDNRKQNSADKLLELGALDAGS